MPVGDVPLTPIIDTVTGSVTEIGRIFLRTLTAAVGALAPIDAAYWTSQAAGVLSAEVNLGALASGYLKLATAVGIATPSTVATIPQSDITGLTASLAGLAPLASPAFTGTPTAPTAAPGTTTTQLATTAFVVGSIATAPPAAPAAHHATHETGGADALAALSAAIVTSGTLSDARLSANIPRIAGGNTFTGTQIINAPVVLNGGVAIFGHRLSVLFDASAAQGVAVQNTNAAAGNPFQTFYNSANAAQGSIGAVGTTGVVYNTTSDARLKTDAGRATECTALRALVVHDFAWIADGVRDRGVFAQEAAALFPRAVTPGTDERTADGALVRPWATDYSKFVADLIVGWQQHDATIAELRAELAALKGSR